MKQYQIDLDLFPIGLRKLMEIGFPNKEAWIEEAQLYDTSELLMAQQILEQNYPGEQQIWRKQRLRVEIRRRTEKKKDKGTLTKSKFAIEWEKACEPFRRLRNG